MCVLWTSTILEDLLINTFSFIGKVQLLLLKAMTFRFIVGAFLEVYIDKVLVWFVTNWTVSALVMPTSECVFRF